MRPKRRAMIFRPTVFPRLPPASGERSSERLARAMTIRAAHAMFFSGMFRDENRRIPPQTVMESAMR
jgi:hypothetical protein